MINGDKSRQKHIRVGYSIDNVPNIKEVVDNYIYQSKYNYTVIPLVFSHYNRNTTQKEPFGRCDLELTSDIWSEFVVAKCSKNYEIESINEVTRRNAEKTFCDEIRFVCHMSIESYIVPIYGPNNSNLARILNSFLQNEHRLQYFKFAIRLPMWNNTQNDLLSKEITDDNDDLRYDTWHWWSNLIDLCGETRSLGVILELTADLPPQEVLNRWFSEPIKAIVVPTSLFLSNKAGFPVLTKAHQKCLMKFMGLNIDVIIEGICRHEHGIDKYREYINYLYRNQDQDTIFAEFTRGYEDYLQTPLQPLSDNLEASVYETFEKDPCKYLQYKRAIAQALIDRVSENEKTSIETVIMVVGAGRGPLVEEALQAANETGRKVKLYAIEKNPNAVNTLLYRKSNEWGDKVEVISTDMRTLKSSIKADIMVSELLGSFGCNELSPECLYGAQELLKDDGISIPQKYRSFIAPIQSYKNFCQTKNNADTKHPHEVPYVVLLHNHYVIDKAKPIFEFNHPVSSDQMDTTRFASTNFKASIDCTLHGIAGYFDCNLYKDITLSIVPETHSQGLFSWFSMFFPIYNPISLRANDTITINFWRLKSAKQVWYEWCVAKPKSSKICNPNGRTYSISLY